MALKSFKCTDFRCLASAEFEFSPGNNLIYGQNASGKTSILEAVAYLGRGRSFRGAATRELIRHGEAEFLLVGKAVSGRREVALGVRNSVNGLEVHTDGEKRQSAAALAEALPLQVIDPDVHALVAGGPEHRRRYVDWIAFHVEHNYLELWRRFRRALKQRNALLKSARGRAALGGWNEELAELGNRVHEVRLRMLGLLGPALQRLGGALLGSAVGVVYQQGWSVDKTLLDALANGVDRDLQLGGTQSGPQRADLRLNYDERQARKLVSRGQQKLLACALILAATELVQAQLQKPLLLLLDDPSAELDGDSVGRLMASIEALGCQVIATTLERDRPLFSAAPRLFHVEQGQVGRA